MTKKTTLKSHIKLKHKTSQLLFLLTLLLSVTALSTAQGGMKVYEGTTVSCPLSHEDAHSRQGLTTATHNISQLLEREKTAEFIVTFGPEIQQDPEAMYAFQFAIDIWSREIASSVPIRLSADYRSLASNTLAEAGPIYFVSDFPNAPEPSTSYPGALANAIAGAVLQPDQPFDLSVVLNRDINFYLGTDGITPEGQFDFVTTALHEIGHGLGFISSNINALGASGGLTLRRITDFPFPYSNLLINADGIKAIDLPDPSLELRNYFTSNAVFINGTNAIAALAGEKPQVEAPPFYAQGSAVSHWDENTFPSGDPNSLMTPFTAMSESIFDIGDITRGLLKDMGWRLGDTRLFALSVGEAQGEFETRQGATAVQTLIIKNTSETPFVYTARLSQNPEQIAITLNNADGITLRPGEETSITLTYDTVGLEPGVFTAALNITTNTSTIALQRPLRLGVLNGTEVAEISTVERIQDTLDVLVNRFSNTFEMRNTGNRLLNYTVTVANASAPFISIDNPEGIIFRNSAEDIAYTINAEALPEGTHTADLIITSNATNTPSLSVPVSLTIVDLPKPIFDITIDEAINVAIDVDARDPVGIVRFNVSNPGALPLEYELTPLITDLITLDTRNARGTLQPGETARGSFIVITGAAATGRTITSEIVFNSNDPAASEIRRPLTVMLSRERGRLALRSTPAFSANIEIGSSEIRRLEFENIGTIPVLIEDVQNAINTEIINWSAPSGNRVNPGEVLTVTTRFTPRGRAGLPVRGAVRILNNGTIPNENSDYNFFSTLVAPSGLVVSKTSIFKVLNINATTEASTTEEITISNVEDTPITYSIRINTPTDSTIAIDTTGGTLAPGESTSLVVTLNGNMQSAGVFENAIVITRDALDTPEAIIDTRLEIVNTIGRFNPDPIVDLFVEDSSLFGFVELTNTGNAPIHITELLTGDTYENSDIFALLNDTPFSEANAMLPPNGVLIIELTLETNTPNAINDVLIVRSNAATPELRLPLIFGEITPPETMPGTFGPDPIVDVFVEDTTAFAFVELTNTGNTPIHITELLTGDTYENSDIFALLNDAPFSEANAMLPPNGVLIIELTLETNTPNAIDDVLIVRSNAATPELRLPLIFGEITPPETMPSTFGPDPIVDVFVEDTTAFAFVELTNTGSTPIHITELLTEGVYENSDIFALLNDAPFSEANAMLPPNGVLIIELTLETNTPNAINDVLIVRSNAATPELRLPLIFGAITPPETMPSTFGPDPIVDVFVEDTTAFAFVELTNTGSTPIHITELITEGVYENSDIFAVLNDAPFSEANAMLPPNGVLIIELTLETNTPNAINDVLIVRSNAATPELRLPLIFGAITPPETMPGTFGPDPIVDVFVEDTTAFAFVELTNTGNTPIHITELLTEGVYENSDIFAVLNDAPFSEANAMLPPNGVLIIELTLETNTPNAINDVLIVRSNAATPELRLPLIFNDETLNSNAPEDLTTQTTSLSLFPNPVRSNATFKVFTSAPKSVLISLRNTLQQELAATKYVRIDANGNGEFMSKGLQSGLYILTIKDPVSGKVYQSKVIKN